MNIRYKSRGAAFAAAAVLAVGATAATAAAASPGHVRHPVTRHAACEKVQIEVRVPGGMPGVYQLILCGPGIPADTIVCPTDSYQVPSTGSTLACKLG